MSFYFKRVVAEEHLREVLEAHKKRMISTDKAIDKIFKTIDYVNTTDNEDVPDREDHIPVGQRPERRVRQTKRQDGGVLEKITP